MKKIFIITIFIFSKSIWGMDFAGFPAIILEDNGQNWSNVYTVNSSLEYYIEPDLEILQEKSNNFFPPDFSRFVRNYNNLDNFGFHKNGVGWFHFRIDASRLKSSEKWIVYLEYPLLDKIDFYYESTPGYIQHEQSGDRRPFDIRRISAFASAFYLDSPDLGVKDYYLRVQMGGPMLVQLKIIREDVFNAKNDKLFLLFGVFIGILITLLLYNLMVYFITWERAFLYYTIALLALDLTLLDHMGFLLKYLQTPSFIHDRTAPIAIPIIITFYFLFVRNLVDIKFHDKIADRILKIIQISQVAILGIALVINVALAHFMVWIDGAISTSVLVAVVFYIARRFRDTMAIFVFIGVFFFFIGYIALLLSLSSISKWSDSANYGIVFTTSLEHIFLSWLIVIRSRKLENLNIEMSHQLEKTSFTLLQERMKPHFLFNTFTMIYQMIRSGYPKADSVVLNLSDVYRYLSENSQKPLVPIIEDWEFSLNFLRIMEERFKGRVTVDTTFDKSLLPIYIPPMTIQPVIENCFKHGIKNKRSLKVVLHAVSFKEDGAKIIIQDDGFGLETPDMKSHTLDNIRKRISRFYENTTTSMQNNPTGGVIVHIHCYGFKGDLNDIR